MDFTLRPYAGDADAAEIAGMFNAVEVHVGGEPLYSAHEVGTWMADTADVLADTRLIVTEDGTVAGFGWLGSPVPGATRISAHGAVAAAFRGHGLGRDLLAWQIERARAIHAASAPAAAWTVYSSTNGKDAAAVRLLERAGMHVQRHFLDMTADLTLPAAAPAAGLPEGIVSVPFRPEDARAVHAAHMESFAEHFGFQPRTFEGWSRHHPEAADFRDDLCRIAVDGGEVAGLVLCHDDVAGDRVTAAAYVSTVGTRPRWRGRGIASALLVEVMAAARAAGKTQARLGVDATNPTGAVALYERLGFRTVARSVIYGLELAPVAAMAGAGATHEKHA